ALTTVISTTIGTAAPLYVVRHARRQSLLSMALVAPLQPPGIMDALALLIFYYAVGLGGSGDTDLLLCAILVSMTDAFTTLPAVLSSFDRPLEEAGRSLGA